MRILAKNSILNRLSLSQTFSRFDNTFFVICVDDFKTIHFYKNIVKFNHSSLLRNFKLSDSYLCFLNINDFSTQLQFCIKHLKTNVDDGTNAIIGYIYKGIFINFINIVFVENLLIRYNYNLDFENLFLQMFMSIIMFIESFILDIINSFFFDIENELFWL